MKMKNVTKMAIAGVFCAMILTGCELFNADKKAEIRDKAHAAIIEFLETKGQDKALEYIDKLVAEGKLGTANAEKIKAAIPLGIDKVKEVMKGGKTDSDVNAGADTKSTPEQGK